MLGQIVRKLGSLPNQRQEVQLLQTVGAGIWCSITCQCQALDHRDLYADISAQLSGATANVQSTGHAVSAAYRSQAVAFSGGPAHPRSSTTYHFRAREGETSSEEDVEEAAAEDLSNSSRLGTDINSTETQDPGSVNLAYRSPTELMWPPDKHQQKFAARVQRGLETLLYQGHDVVWKELIMEHGLTVEEVRMSPDNMVAYILWSCWPEHVTHTQRQLSRHVRHIRAWLAKTLKTRRVPRLEFRLNQISEQQQQIEDVFEKLEKE